MTWLIWSLLLILQNASFTLVSRARNSSSIGYHAAAAVLSNGIWFASQFFVVNLLVTYKSQPLVLACAGLLYVTLTTSSSVSMHKFLLKFEKKIKKGGMSNV